MLVGLLARMAPAHGAVPARDYDGYFQRRHGWTGADGAYSVPLGNGRVLWLFSDTFVGDVVHGHRAPDTVMVHNSMAIQAGKRFTFFTRHPLEPPDGRGWLWMYAATPGPSPGTVDLFCGQFQATSAGGAFGFRAIGLWLGRLRVQGKRIRLLSMRRVKFFRAGPASLSFGSAVMTDGPWTYVYGVIDTGLDKRAVVARVPRYHLADPGCWRFYDGSGWSLRMSRAAPIADGVSMEFSVNRTRVGDYLMVAQRGGASADVQVRRARHPWGPWSTPVTVWHAPECHGSQLTYNAKAHPELSDKRGLLISYNVNSTKPEQVMEHAGIYRPRFIRLPGVEYLPARVEPWQPQE